MKIGMVSDSLGYLSFEEVLETAAELGIQQLEFCCGNWSSAPHIDLDNLLENDNARKNFLSQVKDHNLEISALNCSGNQLAPGEAGTKHDEVVRKTFELAKKMDIDRVVMMSGLPGGPGDANPNWVITVWPQQQPKILQWQWEEVALPYWKNLLAVADNNGIEKICIELHAEQLVYNTHSMLKFRDALGERVGANLDPSHLVWMGGDPLSAVRRLGDAIYYVHAKDTRIDPENAGPDTLLETRPNDAFSKRAWNYVTLGYGHDALWWRTFISLLRQVGYNDVLSIEHEDVSMPAIDGVRQSVDLLKGIV